MSDLLNNNIDINDDNIPIIYQDIYEIELNDNIILEYNKTDDYWLSVHNDQNKFDDGIIIEDNLFDENGEILLFDDYILTKEKFNEIKGLVNGNISKSV